jgi:carbohydrate esterase-like sialic acid-specific acetylesterase
MLGRREFISWLGSFIAGRDDLADDPLRESTATNVIFVAGQSNAVGWNETAATVPSLLQRPSGAMIWTGRAWQYLVNGTNNGKLSSNGSKWGCEAEFARLWALERNERLFIVKHAVGGTALADYWSPGTGTGYIAMTRYATTAKSALTGKGYTVNCIGLLWMQGESDAVNQAQANAYCANLSNFFARVRSDWGSASMPIVVGRIADQAELTYRTVVRAAQAEVVAGDGHAALVDTDAYGNDGLHYSTNGIVDMGADMYAAWKTLARPA